VIAAEATPPAAGRAPQALIGFGQVWHRRLRPAVHAFSHDTYFLLLPMRSLRAQPSAHLRRNRFGALSFHDRDHGDGRDDALAWLDELLHSERILDAQGEVWLHTLPRVLGHTFKPVSFWYAHRADGSLAAVVAEVNNTFGERHCYLMAGPALRWGGELQVSKAFHVSPFCTVGGRYRFRFALGGGSAAEPRRTLARIDHDDEQGPLLQTRIGGMLEPLTAASARRAFFGMPLMTLGVIARIHWHALRLALKRVPVQARPSAPDHFVTR
jgi:uncharacterized protein